MTEEDFTRALAARVLPPLGLDPALAYDGWRTSHPFPVAIRLQRLGFRILPTNPQSKIPCIRNWPEKATTDPAKLVQWQRRFNPNFSILTGRAGGVIVLDIDGDRGRADFAKLEAELGPLPHTIRVLSGRADGGEHIWLRPPVGDGDPKNQQPLPGYKVDVRGHNGHIVIPGSLHKSGNRYAFAPGCAPDEL